MMDSWKKTLWHRVRMPLDDDGITRYKDANFYRINYQPASGFLAIQQYGEKISEIWAAYVDARQYQEVFHEGDIVYLDGDKPQVGTDEYERGADATALVTAVQHQNLRIHLEFTRIRNKNAN